MYPDRYDEISSALKEKNVSQPCPRCESKSFTIVGESELLVYQKGSGILSQKSKTPMPIVVIVCNNCGFIANHASIALGLKIEGA